MSDDNPFEVEAEGSYGGPALNAFDTRNSGADRNFWEELWGKSSSRQVELLGGTSGQQRFQQNAPRYQDWAAVQQTIPNVPKPGEPGIFSKLMDYALRPASAVMGAATGFLGLDRYTKDQAMLGDSMQPSRSLTAFTRFRQGLSGEVRYNFADFTPIAKRKSEGEIVPMYQNAANVFGGFVVDTAFDPLTYVSFGGNLYGRKAGAQYVSGKVQQVADDVVGSPGFDPYRFLVQTYESGRASAITPAAFAAKMNRLRSQALSKNLISKPADKSLLINADFSANQSLETLLATAQRVSTGKVDFLREIAREWLPDAAGMQYWTGSSRGLRKWLIRTMGIDNGMDFYRALPKDIQGGLRIRIPFIRDEGIPVSLGLAPAGGGQIAEALAKRGFKQMEQFLDATEVARDVIRSVFFKTPGMRQLLSNGKYTDVAYQAIVDATGKKVTDGRTAFVTYGDFERANWRNIAQANVFNTQQTALRIAANEQFAENVKDLPVQERRRVSREVFLFLSDRERLDLAEAGKVTLNKYEELALGPASLSRVLLDAWGEEIKELGIDEKTLKNFAMRQKTRRTRSRQALNEDFFSPSGGGKADTLKSPRDSHVFEWEYSLNEGATVARWKIADDIMEVVDGEWENPYVTDFITSLFEYGDDITKTLDSWRMTKIFMDAGIFTPIEKNIIQTYSTSLIERNLNELVGQEALPGAVQKIRKRILKEFFEGVSESDADLWVTNATLKQWVANTGRGYNVSRSRALAADLQQMGLGVRSREALDIYDSVGAPASGSKSAKSVAETFDSRSDNSRIERLKDGRYRLVLDDMKTESMHASYGEAVEASRVAHVLLRDGKYNNEIIEESYKILQKVDDILFFNIGQDPIVELGGRAGMLESAERRQQLRLNARWGIETYINQLPPAEAEKAREVIHRRALELVRFFRPDDVEFIVDGFGNFQPVGRLYAHMSKEVKEDFRNFLQENSWADLKNRIALPTGELDEQGQAVLKQRIVGRIEEVVAPRVVMDTFIRMNEIARNPNIFIDNIYNPTYSMIRSAMTIQRGPGFSGRNWMGGSYNASLYGVGKQHQIDSGKALLARRRTRKIILDKYGDDAYSDPRLHQEMADTFKAELEKIFDGTGTYIDGVKDSDAIFEAWELAYNADVVGSSRAGRLVGEVLLRAPFEFNRLGPTSIARPFDRVGKLADYIDVSGTNGGSRSADVADRAAQALEPPRPSERYASAMQKISTDWWWPRKFMGPLAANVEDQIRFASFLKGVQDFGLEPRETGIRGFAAASMVKITQFDYTDLSPWELRFFKNLLPFWVWTRNNIPLQIRATINNPRRIARIGRTLEAAQDLFQHEPEGPMPTYADNQFNIYISDKYWEGAPEILKNVLPQGTVAISPLPFLDPVVDLNRWFRMPSEQSPNPVNWPELANNINPILTGIAELFGVMGANRDYSGRDYRDAPDWMQVLPPGLGQSREDVMDPGTFVANQNARNFYNTIIPQIGLLERYAPWFFGDERQENKWITTMVSSLTGITISTVDDLQVAGEMQRQIEQTKWYTDRMFGPSAEHRIEMIRRLLDEGATLDFIEKLDISTIPTNEVDIQRAVNAWKIYQAIEQTYLSEIENNPGNIANVYNELVAPYRQYLSEEQLEEGIIAPGIWQSLAGFRGDFTDGIRAGSWQAPKTEEILEAGSSRREIDRLFSTARNEDAKQEERDAAVRRLYEIHETIATNRRIGMFTVFGTRVEGWEPDDE